ncbi:hypothetical protein GCM10025868_17360 [Angustibacter aerolatus]|uniref:ABC transporter permease n=1 Tax=Angustibacter aerolatus TaxID=1162965 RepID=A0ABQ6JE58_9ACTN|nr:hypothetical protein GCM10025868_17360 [Angustibacter aerolatus]
MAALPAFLPLAVGVVSGEAVAGEANLGTLRYLLVTPVNRTRLLAVKYVSVVFYGLVAALVVAASGVITGALLFPVGDVTLISGSTVGYGDGLLRALLVALYVAACLAAVAAIGVFVSTLTEVPIAAMATTVVLVLVLEILDSIPQARLPRPVADDPPLARLRRPAARPDRPARDRRRPAGAGSAGWP